MEFITIHQWVPLNKSTREELKKVFLIKMSGLIKVETDSRGVSSVLDDGVTDEDLRVITVEKLQDFLGSIALNDTLEDLFKQTVIRIESPIENPITSESLESFTPTEVPLSDVLLPLPPLQENTATTQLQCEKCPFQTGSKFALRMHVGKNHKPTKV